MTADQEAQAERVAAARQALKQAMSLVPKAVLEGGATRVQAFLKALDEGRKVLAREGLDPVPYEDARRRIETVASISVAELAKDLYGGKK